VSNTRREFEEMVSHSKVSKGLPVLKLNNKILPAYRRAAFQTPFEEVSNVLLNSPSRN